jgi:hypothetical protein
LELATFANTCPSGRLTLPAISAIFTITYVAKMLDEDEDWLHELSIDMFAEDGCLRVYGVGEDGVTAFTDYEGRSTRRQIFWVVSRIFRNFS